MDDPACLFNWSLEGKVRRAIDFHEGEKVNEKAFKALIREAVELDTAVAGDEKASFPLKPTSPEPGTWGTRVGPLPGELRDSMRCRGVVEDGDGGVGDLGGGHGELGAGASWVIVGLA